MSKFNENECPAASRACASRPLNAIDGNIDGSHTTGHSHEMEPCEAVAMLRLSYESPDFCDGTCLIAVDRPTFKGPVSDLSDNAIAVQLGVLVGRIPPVSLEDYKMGAAICDRLGIGTPPEWLTALLGLNKADRDLKRALEAALCGVLATTVGPVDVATILFAIGTFIHAHPYFKEVVKEAGWEHPFGEHTAYQMAWFDAGETHEQREAEISRESETTDLAGDAR